MKVKLFLINKKMVVLTFAIFILISIITNLIIYYVLKSENIKKEDIVLLLNSFSLITSIIFVATLYLLFIERFISTKINYFIKSNGVSTLSASCVAFIFLFLLSLFYNLLSILISMTILDKYYISQLLYPFITASFLSILFANIFTFESIKNTSKSFLTIFIVLIMGLAIIKITLIKNLISIYDWQTLVILCTIALFINIINISLFIRRVKNEKNNNLHKVWK